MKLFGRFRKAKAPAEPVKLPEPAPEPADLGVGIFPYDPTVVMLGAENRGGVTCYIDALLFAMFCRLEAFECLLEAGPDGPTASLARLLRTWVNMLRSGLLIRTDLTKQIQDAFGDCGWPDARFLEQQDTSEAFAFLTETLQLPLLSLQVDLFHDGKRDDDDHKVVHERLLNLAVPPDPEGKGIKLEDCLEDYFNAQVDVLRDSEVMKKSLSEDVTERPGLPYKSVLPFLSEDTVAVGSAAQFTSSPVDMAPLHRFPTHSSIASTSAHVEAALDSEAVGDEPGTPASRQFKSRKRSSSIIQRIVVDENGKPIDLDNGQPAGRRRKGSVVVKAVTIPAWQFFRLIPWNAPSMSLSSHEPQTNSDVAKKFAQRPVVGICLKRYVMTESGRPKRHNTFIDIPDSLRLPHFMVGDGKDAEEELYGLNTGYKLVLQSVICHRGDSVYSGHYIAFARVAPKVLTGNRRHEFDPPPDYEEAQWVLFDDLEERRVTYVDDFKKALEKEMPYLLFYQMVPTVEVSCPSPPAY